MGRRAFFAAGAGVAVMAATRNAKASDWEVVSRSKGVVVSLREEADREFPTFRGVGRIAAPMWDVFAVVSDVDSHTQWMHQCAAARVIETESKRVRYVYNRTDAPWPVADRDVVVRSEVTFPKDGSEIRLDFKGVTNKGFPVLGVIRMPFMKGSYHLEAESDVMTKVEYQVNADPGGTIPDWLVERVTRDLPMHTVANLRAHSVRKAGTHDIAKLKAELGYDGP
jgi:hypothetical protein